MTGYYLFFALNNPRSSLSLFPANDYKTLLRQERSINFALIRQYLIICSRIFSAITRSGLFILFSFISVPANSLEIILSFLLTFVSFISQIFSKVSEKLFLLICAFFFHLY